jgi:heterodisulfide reductase subunit B
MKLAYYPGCSQESAAIEYGMSMLKMAEALGIEFWEIPQWNCCGATAAHSVNHLLSLALPARNLAIAEQNGLDVVTPCAGCYSRLKATEHSVREDAQKRKQVQEAIAMNYEASNRTFSVLELLVERLGIDFIRSKAAQSLKGLKPACYYGCLLVRPVEQTGFDDPEDPQSMDKLVSALGAEPVDWPFKTECCGAALTNTRPEIGLKMTQAILKNAVDAGANCILTACPICMLNLDMRQSQIEQEFKVSFDLPVYYVTELVAVAVGVSAQDAGIHLHFVEAEKRLHNLLAKAREEKIETMEKKKLGHEDGFKEKGLRDNEVAIRRKEHSAENLKDSAAG